jgi:hypothetical protein
VIEGLGPDRDALREEIKREMGRAQGDRFEIATENNWVWGSDGKEEREQTVVRLRRGILFLHLYQYGENLYVGWDGHVNCGNWDEKVVTKGYEKSTGELCAVHTIAAGWHVPNEYDITDTNCLIEQVHAVVVRCVKLKVAEKRIDQEIDFKIVREARQGVAGRAEPAGSGAPPSLRKRFLRVG